MFDLLSSEDREAILWYTPWRFAGKDWLTDCVAFAQTNGSFSEVQDAFSEADGAFLMNIPRYKLIRMFGISDASISNQWCFKQWVDFPYELYSEALSLAGCVATLSQVGLNDEMYSWASRFAKALHSASWGIEANQLPQKVGLLLLKRWLGPVCWERVRLSFPKKMVIEVEQEEELKLPYRRVDTMWRAIFCYLLDSDTEQ